MDRYRILHFVNERTEYIVITDGDAPAEDHCLPGFKLKTEHAAEIEEGFLLPTDVVLMRRD